MLKYFNNIILYKINILIENYIFYQCFYDYDCLSGNSNDYIPSIVTIFHNTYFI